MKRLFLTILILGLFSTLFAKGKLRISTNIEGAYIYINGKKKAMSGDGYTTILLEEGEYEVKIYKEDEDAKYEGSKKVFIGDDTATKITIKAKKTLTDSGKLKELQRVTVVIGDIMYQNQPFTKEYKWQEAKRYCKNLTIGGYQDWRLPTKKELNRIANITLYGTYDDGWKKWYEANKYKRYKNAKWHYYFIKKEFLENMTEYSSFWTSQSKDSSRAWNVNVKRGYDYWYSKSNDYYVLCVREQ